MSPQAPPPLRPSSHVPVFNATRVTLWLIVANVAIHILREFLGRQAYSQVMFNYGFIPAMFVRPGGGLVVPPDADIWLTPLSYAFLHGDWIHLGINMMFLLAFGTPVERRLGPVRFLLLYLACAVLAVVGSTISYWFSDGVVLIVGASGAISGLFGATIRFSRFRLRGRSPDQPGRPVAPVVLVLSFVVINVLFGITGFGTFSGFQAVAWEAHVAGFLAGLLLFGLFDRRQPARPGG